jgi:hypothetical protein
MSTVQLNLHKAFMVSQLPEILWMASDTYHQHIHYNVQHLKSVLSHAQGIWRSMRRTFTSLRR